MTLYARGRIATVTLKSGGIRINDLKDLADPRVKRIAIANPQHAPYGLAAKQAIEAVGLWTDAGAQARVRRERAAGRAVCPQRIG